MKRLVPTVRLLAWAGGMVIASLAAQAGYEIWQGYREALRWTERDLSAQARVVAEQTARSVQAVEVLLRNIAERIAEQPSLLQDAPRLKSLFLAKAQGLMQGDGLVVVDATGTVRLASHVDEALLPTLTFGKLPVFTTLRDARGSVLHIERVVPTPGSGRMIIPVALRIEASDGSFLGVVGVPVREQYFQTVYREGFGGQGTRTALMHRTGWLLARNPPAPNMLGKRLDVLDRLLPPGSAQDAAFARLPSPVDGADHFVALRRLPDYPLVVALSKDHDTALAPWRSGAVATAVRTGVLCSIAGLLLWLALRQLARVQKTQQELQASQQRYSLAAAGSDMGLWDWDFVDGTTFVSLRARELLGIDEPSRPLTVAEVREAMRFFANDKAAFEAGLKNHLDGRTACLELEFRVPASPDGFRWVHVRAICTRADDGTPLRLAGSVSDVDQRKRAQRELAQSEERYALAMAGSRAGHWVWNVTTDELFVSEKYHELVGLAAEPPLTTREAFFSAVGAATTDIDQVRQLSAELVAGNIERAEYEMRVRTSLGERWIQTRAQRFDDPGGLGLRVAGVSVDITERKQAELERVALEEQLRQAQKLEAIGTLAGGIAHDFNNILAGILGYGEMAQKEAPAGSSIRRHIDAAMAAGLRAKSLVERILAFSRSGMGQRVPVHVQSVVQEALDGLKSTLPAGIRLEVQLRAGDAGVMGDPTQIHQVVMNLCMNAVQAMRSEGQIRVELQLEQFESEHALPTAQLAPGRYLRLDVEDTGMGMPASVISRIFDPFFTTKEVGVGTGLGLSLVHGIVVDLGGGIAVESEPGRGSRFTVFLPLLAAGVVSPTPREQAIQPGDGEVVMVVDDEEALVQLAEETLAELGYEPVGFSAAQAALDALKRNPNRFDLLLSDESMPGMTGTQLITQARALAPALPVIMMSGFVTPVLQAKAKELGVHQVLNKPLMAAEMAAALGAALQGRRTTEDQS